MKRIIILCLVIFIQNNKKFIAFFLLCISGNNLLDELFFNPTEYGYNDYIILIIVIDKIDGNAKNNIVKFFMYSIILKVLPKIVKIN